MDREAVKSTPFFTESTMGGVFVIIFVSSSLLYAETVSGLGTIFGNFQKLHQHPALNKCAETILHKNEYVGFRVSEQTGVCEGLSHDWGRNQTTESGFAYAKKLGVTENFQPPVRSEELTWVIPGVLNSGAKLDAYISVYDPDRVTLTLSQSLNGPGCNVEISFFAGHTITVREYEARPYLQKNSEHQYFEDLKERNAQFYEQEVFKISFMAQTDSFAILVDDEEKFTFKPVTDIDTLSIISAIHTGQLPLPTGCSIHRLQFTGN